MSNLTSTIRGEYPLHTFETLRELWQQMVKTILHRQDDTNGQEVRLVTDAEIAVVKANSVLDVPQFSLIQSDRFQALLLTQRSVDLANSAQIAIEITFDPVAIEQFLQPLMPSLPATVKLIPAANFTNDSYLQTHFTQLILSAIAISEGNLTTEQTGDALGANSVALTPKILVPTGIELAATNGTESIPDRAVEVGNRELNLKQQITEANLLNDLNTQIHQTLDLHIILQTTVDRVQTFLHADRLIIYQFEFAKVDGKVSNKSFDAYSRRGKVVYESLRIADLPSVLDIVDAQDCFDDRLLWEKYRGGITKSIDSIELEYRNARCMLDLMRRAQVQSKLIVPIVVSNDLWGLAIAHQCQAPRQWQFRETQFLQQVAKHLAFAIDRSEFYTTSLWHTQNLEHRVNERTRELRDAVIVAQTANQSKTEFLALLSHELRTPLTSILGLSATLLRLPLTNLTDRQHNYLQTIHNSGEHLSELIDDILDFYKLEVGKTFLKVSEFSLSKLLKQVLEIVRDKAAQGQISLEMQIINNGNDVSQINGRDLRFRGDTKRIRQILLNILINAIKFTPEHGTVIIRAWLEDCYAVFEIEDSGIGIEAEQIPRLFKKFHQLNPNYNRDYEGMGLGLAITQQLVELHGGWIDVESEVGSGSTFTVRIASQPLKLPDSNDWQEMDRKLVFQDPELNPIPNRIILIAQDEDLANFMCDILTTARYQVTWLLSAESSFRQIAMFAPSLLIIDLTLDINTVDRLLDNIRKSSKIGDTKILGIATKDDIISPISKQYVDDYLWKQVNPEQLLRKITKLLS
jgi:two-component system, sensor histidine kinase and response regulator